MTKGGRVHHASCWIGSFRCRLDVCLLGQDGTTLAVLAELSRRALVPAVCLLGPEVRAERELARFRLHLVRHRTALKNRIHAALMAFGHPCPVSDLFGVWGRELLDRLGFPEPWRGDLEASLRLIDSLDFQIAELEGGRATRRRRRPSLCAPPVDGARHRLGPGLHRRGGDRRHRPVRHPSQVVRLHRAVPRVYQSGESDHRGSLAKNGPKYLRWVLIEAATHAAPHPIYAERYQRTAKRLGCNRGERIARVTSPAAWPKRSGTCCRPTSPSHPQAP